MLKMTTLMKNIGVAQNCLRGDGQLTCGLPTPNVMEARRSLLRRGCNARPLHGQRRLAARRALGNTNNNEAGCCCCCMAYDDEYFARKLLLFTTMTRACCIIASGTAQLGHNFKVAKKPLLPLRRKGQCIVRGGPRIIMGHTLRSSPKRVVVATCPLAKVHVEADL